MASPTVRYGAVGTVHNMLSPTWFARGRRLEKYQQQQQRRASDVPAALVPASWGSERKALKGQRT